MADDFHNSEPTEMLTRASLTALPGTSNRFFVLVDLNELSLQSVVSIPTDGSCPFATTVEERCEYPNIPAGMTETMIFVVKANASPSTSATLPIRSSFVGRLEIDGRSVIHDLSREGTVSAEKTPTL